MIPIKRAAPPTRKVALALASLVFVLGSIAVLAWIVAARSITPTRSDQPLNGDERAELVSAVTIMRARGLETDAELAMQLLHNGLWRAASTGDVYIKTAEDQGDTPFAYTLSDGYHPKAIVLASRFFDDTTDTGRAAIMIHELGHYRAYVTNGCSTEFDGYKAEYDKSRRLGLSEKDGLVYFGMLDGVEEYVVPVDPAYAKKTDVAAYINLPANE